MSSQDQTDQDGDEATIVHETIDRPELSPGSPATDWETYFPFDEPYDAQREAIEQTHETLLDGGFAVAELACGTGKTLFSLMRGIELVRDPTTPYKRVMALTSVKQQIRAFEDDLKAINRNLGEDIPPVSALTAVGKADLCSYVDTGRIDDDRIYSRCEELREPIRKTLAQTGSTDARTFLNSLVDKSEVDSVSRKQPITTEDWNAPYAEGIPDTDSGGSGGAEFCPFYAKYRRETLDDPEEGGYTPQGVMTPEELRAQASTAGICPHAVMGDAVANAEVIIANYYHAFDPDTVDTLTGGIIDQETLLICDEAHMLVPRVRDVLSQSLSRWKLQRTIDEIESEILNQSHQGVDRTIRETLTEHFVSLDNLRKFVKLLRDLQDELERRAATALDESDDVANWREQSHPDLPEDIQQPLRDPRTPQPDDFSEWAADEGYTDLLGHAKQLCDGVVAALRQASQHHQGYTRLNTYSETVGQVLQRWADCDHEQYIRTIELHKRQRAEEREFAWAGHYSAHLTIENCLPAEEIATQLDHFGGGILMSATLEPLDVYRRTIGLDHLEENGRPVREIVAGLPFPPENRGSFAVGLEKFTYGNRGPTNPRWRDDEQDDVRDDYASVIRDIARTTDGNVLVAMPSYSEGEWAAKVLREDTQIEKKVLVDQSSSNEITESLKDEFFGGAPKALVTSLRGTLTEGVDYEGDRLDACVVCGVPITNIDGPVPTAIRTAYEREFGKHNGFDFAFTVPAVRKARQALGRVIRGADETGVRVAADRRYASPHNWDDVREYLPEYEQNDYEPTQPETLLDEISHLNQRW